MGIPRKALIEMQAVRNLRALREFITVDPGLSTGAAWWLKGDEGNWMLWRWVKLNGDRPISPGWGSVGQLFNVLAELPEPRRKGTGVKATPEDLITLGIRLGRAAQVFNPHQLLLVAPSTWKGSLPKDVHHARVRKALPGRFPADVSPDVLDAVALGLWALGC